MTVQELYNESIKPLPAADRLRLAANILNEIAPVTLEQAGERPVDIAEEWSDKTFAISQTPHGGRSQAYQGRGAMPIRPADVVAVDFSGAAGV